jgi:membrane-associated protein
MHSAPGTVLASALSPDSLLHHHALLVLAVILFAECGLLIGFFLPGDTILFAAGIELTLHTLHASLASFLIVIPLAAILGNIVGYAIGRRAGPVVFDRPKSRLFKPEHVTRSAAFFERYGWATIVLARFAPIVRTVATVMAGVGRMPFGRYLISSIIGAILWADGVLLLGYWLGHIKFVQDNKGKIDYAVLAVIVLSLLPTLVHLVRSRRHRGEPTGGEPTGGTATGDSPAA